MSIIFDEIVFRMKKKILSTEKPQSAIQCISFFLTALFWNNEIAGIVYAERYEPAETRMTGKVKQARDFYF